MKLKALSLLSLILLMVIGMGNASAQTAADVTGSTTWNWSLAGVEEVKLTADTTPTKSEVFLLSQVVPSTEKFNSDALIISAEYPVRAGKYYQGGYIKFHTTVPGTVKVTFSNTGNRLLDDKTTEDETLRRWLYINGKKTASGSCVSSTNTVSEAVPVEAGDVEITAYIDGTEASQYIRVYTVEFVADSEGGSTEEPGEEPGDTPSVDPSASHLLWDYTETAPSPSPDRGLTYASSVNDGAGTNNGLKGIKMNSSGYAYFTKDAVAGTLKLTFGPRKESSKSSLNVYTYSAEPKAETLVATTPEVQELQTVSIDLTAEQNNIYITRATTVEQVLTKIEFVPFVARTFKDFEMVLGSLSAEFDTSTLPKGVTFEGSYNSDTHGYRNAVITVPVDGTVKFTYSSCSYGNQKFSVKNAQGEVVASDLSLTLGSNTCYHQNPANVLTYLYTGEPTTLTFGPIQYLAYFKAEACEVSPCTVTYKDQNGNVLGKVDTFEGESLGEVPYTVADITVPEGSVFRGWVYASGVKVKATDVLSGNTTITASVTPAETVSLGSVQTYNLASSIFYPEDHETIDIQGGSYYNNHGWTMNPEGTISVAVAGNAQVVLKLCEYGNGTTITVTDASGAVVANDVPAKAESGADGAAYSFNYEGEATTLTLTFAAQAYIHGITVYNVQDFITMDENTGYYIVPAGDGASLLSAINSANSKGEAKIFLPNGTYDLGQTTGTAISGKNISLIGESAEGVIIMNAPDVKDEGLSKADLLYNTSEGLYMQDITLKNALDYYNAGGTGRAASFHDQGRNTIAKNVRLLSHQDTYYSHRDGSYFYWEGGEIHGTVDYICGGGNVYFNGITLVNESRSASSNSGDDTMTAAQTNANDKGYVFEGCTVESKCATFNFGRSWGTAKTVYLNTTINSGRLIDTRFNTQDMNSTPLLYAEYNTIDKSGNGMNTPASNVLTFSKGGHFETVLTAEQAEAYSYSNFFNEGWDPRTIAAQAEITAIEADATYLVTEGGKFKAILKGSELDASTFTETTLLRKANARGGFGAPASASVLTAIQAVSDKAPSTMSYTLAGTPAVSNAKGVIIKNNKKYMIK